MALRGGRFKIYMTRTTMLTVICSFHLFFQTFLRIYKLDVYHPSLHKSIQQYKGMYLIAASSSYARDLEREGLN